MDPEAEGGLGLCPLRLLLVLPARSRVPGISLRGVTGRRLTGVVGDAENVRSGRTRPTELLRPSRRTSSGVTRPRHLRDVIVGDVLALGVAPEANAEAARSTAAECLLFFLRGMKFEAAMKAAIAKAASACATEAQMRTTPQSWSTHCMRSRTLGAWESRSSRR